MENALLEMRIIRLEENFYFLEEKLKTLDTHMAAQQAQLDSLEKNMDQMAQSLQAIKAILADSSAGKIADSRPPHYGPETW